MTQGASAPFLFAYLGELCYLSSAYFCHMGGVWFGGLAPLFYRSYARGCILDV